MRRRISALLAGFLIGLTTGCSVQAPPRHPRPALPMPGDTAARFALPGPVEEDLVVPLDRGGEVLRVRLSCGEEMAEMHYWLPQAGPAPLVLLLPILAGGKELMWLIAHDLRARGYGVAWTRRVSSAMREGQRGRQMEDLLRRTVIHNRMALHWLREHDAVDATRTAILGISMGGVVGTLLAAVDPDLRGAAICLAGADLPDITVRSQENRVVRWRDWRALEDGLGASGIHEELRRHLVSDPARLAPYVATERVFMVATLFDDVVPWSHQQLLWESLGRPRRVVVPLGHYTAALGMDWLLDLVDDFLRERLESPV